MIIPSQDLRQCTGCRENKPSSEFYSKSYVRKKDGGKTLSSECKACTKIRARGIILKWSKQQRKEANAKAREKMQRVKAAVFTYYGGYRCACCGETEVLFLTLDHVNNDGAEFRRMIVGDQARGGGQITYYWLFRNGFPDGYQVLCANCQHGKRMNKGVCPHQVRCNDQRQDLVDSSESKRPASPVDDDMVCSTVKAVAAENNGG